jgi:hypothetical protein
VHNNILELKTHFELKLNLIQCLNENNWIKSMCMKYNVHFFNGHIIENISFEIYLQIFILCEIFILTQYTSYVQVCKCLLEFLFKKTNLSLMQYT